MRCACAARALRECGVCARRVWRAQVVSALTGEKAALTHRVTSAEANERDAREKLGEVEAERIRLREQ
eukprot:2884609-Prymnesium_polylepis.1